MSATTEQASVTQLGYVGFGVSNIDAWREFARDLGLQENGTSPRGSTYLRMDEYHHRFELYPTGEDDLLYAGWEVKNAAAMRAVADRIRGQGVEVVEGTAAEAAERMVMGLVKFRDPNGVANEVYYGPFLDSTPVNLPRGISGFKAMDQGLGHVFLFVDDLEESVRFYTEALGARISDYIKFKAGPMDITAAFTHVNPRHHSLAMAAIPRRPGMPTRRLGHFMIEVNSLDDVGYTRALLTEKGHACGGFGRHSNDRMFSFYLSTPSGFEVEYGTGGRTIDNEDEWEIAQYSVASFWGHERPQPQGPAAAQGQRQEQPEHV